MVRQSTEADASNTRDSNAADAAYGDRRIQSAPMLAAQTPQAPTAREDVPPEAAEAAGGDRPHQPLDGESVRLHQHAVDQVVDVIRLPVDGVAVRLAEIDRAVRDLVGADEPRHRERAREQRAAGAGAEDRPGCPLQRLPEA